MRSSFCRKLENKRAKAKRKEVTRRTRKETMKKPDNKKHIWKYDEASKAMTKGKNVYNCQNCPTGVEVYSKEEADNFFNGTPREYCSMTMSQPTPKVRPNQQQSPDTSMVGKKRELDNWEQLFTVRYTTPGNHFRRVLGINGGEINAEAVIDFIRTLLQDARDEERKFIGQGKREWFTKGYREGQETIWRWAVNNGITDKKSFIALRNFIKQEDKK